jgi:hypothetical protein
MIASGACMELAPCTAALAKRQRIGEFDLPS